MSLSLDPNHVWRDFETDGVPSSGKHKPRKLAIRQWTSAMWQAVIALIAEADPEIELPNLLVSATVTGGTANNIIATPNLPLTEPGAQLISLIVASDNTGPMTLNLGEGVKPLLTNGAQAIADGDVKAGDLFLLGDTGSAYRLYADPASLRNKEAAEIAQGLAEAARAAAEAARDTAIGIVNDIASEKEVPEFDSRDTAALFDLVDFRQVTVNRFDAASPLARTVYEQVPQPANVEPAHPGKFQSADNIWFEIGQRQLTLAALGMVGDGDGAGGGTNNSVAFQRVLDFIAANPGVIFDGENLIYRIDSHNFEIVGGLHIRNFKPDYSTGVQNGDILIGGGTEDAPIALSSNLNQNATSANLVSAATVNVGDWGFLESDEDWAVDGDGYVSELVNVIDKSGNTIHFADAINYRYRTANNARFVKVNFIEDVTFENVHPIGNGIPRITTETVQTFTRFEFIRNLRILHCGGRDFGSRIWGAGGCLDVLIDDLHSEGLPDGAGHNYGVAVTDGCHHVTMRHGHGKSHRHFLTTGGFTRVTRHLTIDGSHATGGHDRAPFHAHRNTDHVSLKGVHVGYKGSPAKEAVELHGANCDVDGIIAHGNFSDVLLYIMLVDYERAASGINVRGVNARNARCNNVVAIWHMAPGREMICLNISDITGAGRFGGPLVRPIQGIFVDINEGIVRGMNISGYSFHTCEERLIRIRIQEEAGFLEAFTIGPGNGETLSATQPAIHCQALNDSIMRHGTFIGNTTRGGSRAIQSNGTTQMAEAGNNAVGAGAANLIDGL